MEQQSTEDLEGSFTSNISFFKSLYVYLYNYLQEITDIATFRRELTSSKASVDKENYFNSFISYVRINLIMM